MGTHRVPIDRRTSSHCARIFLHGMAVVFAGQGIAGRSRRSHNATASIKLLPMTRRPLHADHRPNRLPRVQELTPFSFTPFVPPFEGMLRLAIDPQSERRQDDRTVGVLSS